MEHNLYLYILRKDEKWREEIDKMISVILDKYVKKKKNWSRRGIWHLETPKCLCLSKYEEVVHINNFSKKNSYTFQD